MRDDAMGSDAGVALLSRSGLRACFSQAFLVMQWRGASQRLHSRRRPPSPPLLILFRRHVSESKHARRRDFACAFVLMRGVRV